MIIHEESQPPSNLTAGVGSSYGNGISKLARYFFNLLLIVLVTAAFGIPSYINMFLTYTDANSAILNVILLAYSFFVLVPLQYGFSFAFLKAARDEHPSVADLATVLKNYWNIILVIILVAVFITIGFFLFILPGFYFTIKLTFVRYLVVEEKMSALQAIDESWRMTNGKVVTIFLMWLLAIPIMFGGFLLFGIGAILSAMWIEAAFASLYHAVSSKKIPVLVETEPVQQGPFV